MPLRELGRAWEDSDDANQDALADRDGADDDLDAIAKDARANLAGRSADAVKKAPYTQIFPEGIAYYTAAPLDEEERRYGELSDRLIEHLPKTDPVVKSAPKKIAKGIDDFKKASKALANARTAEALAATRLDVAEEAWVRQIEKTYAALIDEGGRAYAEAFFPARSAKAKNKKAADAAATDTAAKTSA